MPISAAARSTGSISAIPPASLWRLCLLALFFSTTSSVPSWTQCRARRKWKVENGNEKVWEPEARRWQKGETYDVRRFGGMAADPAISQRNLQFDARE